MSFLSFILTKSSDENLMKTNNVKHKNKIMECNKIKKNTKNKMRESIFQRLKSDFLKLRKI